MIDEGHETLERQRAEGKITHRQYYLNHQEMKPLYLDYCQQQGIEDCEASAEAFFQYLLKKEEEDHEEAE